MTTQNGTLKNIFHPIQIVKVIVAVIVNHILIAAVVAVKVVQVLIAVIVIMIVTVKVKEINK